MKRLLIIASLLLTLSGCAVIQSTGVTETKPEVTKSMMQKEFDSLPPPASRPLTVAVYGFTDKTGQRRPQANVASLSTAVTQGAETFLIKALQDVSRGKWFDVVERVGIDNLTKERTIIRQMREAYEGKDAKPLMPMQFAGIIMEGGIIGYDSTTTSGGAGMRIFGIGKQTQWSTDTVTISLRAVSVNTGKVLATVTVQKTIMSSADSVTALKFFDNATQSFEAEAGLTINEPGTYAVKSATELAVVELIKEGARKGVWDFKYPLIDNKWHEGAGFQPEPKKEEPKPVVVTPPVPVEVKKEEPKLVPVEVKKEEPKMGTMYLLETSFIYKEPNDKSQRVWQLLKGTEFSITPAQDGWVAVIARDGKKGFVRQDALSTSPVEVPAVVKGNEPPVNKEVKIKAPRAKDEAK